MFYDCTCFAPITGRDILTCEDISEQLSRRAFNNSCRELSARPPRDVLEIALREAAGHRGRLSLPTLHQPKIRSHLCMLSSELDCARCRTREEVAGRQLSDSSLFSAARVNIGLFLLPIVAASISFVIAVVCCARPLGLQYTEPCSSLTWFILVTLSHELVFFCVF